MRVPIRLVARALADCRGLAVVEFAMLLPILVTLLLATVEVGRYAIIYQKLDRVASTMGDLVAQAQTITNTDINNLMASVPNVMTPFSLSGTTGKVIVSQVGLVGGVAKVNWQRTGGGTYSGTSKVGTAGANATLPAGLTVSATESLIVAEVYYNFSPYIFARVAPAKVLYRPAYFRPRIGDLETVN